MSGDRATETTTKPVSSEEGHPCVWQGVGPPDFWGPYPLERGGPSKQGLFLSVGPRETGPEKPGSVA